MSEIDLLREVIARDVADAERRIMAAVDELRAAIEVHTEHIAAIQAAHIPAVEEIEAEIEAAEEPGAEADEEADAEAVEDAIADGEPIPLTDALANEPAAVLTEIAEIEADIEAAADVRPERPHFLQRRVFSERT